jgi:hypothetical protein
VAQRTPEASQRTAARIAGCTLLLLMVSGFTGMFAFGSDGIVAGDAVATAHNVTKLVADAVAFLPSLDSSLRCGCDSVR